MNEMSGNCISMATRSLLTGVWLGRGSVMLVYVFSQTIAVIGLYL